MILVNGSKGIGIPLDIENSKQLFTALAEIISLAEAKDVLETHFKDTLDEIYQ